MTTWPRAVSDPRSWGDQESKTDHDGRRQGKKTRGGMMLPRRACLRSLQEARRDPGFSIPIGRLAKQTRSRTPFASCHSLSNQPAASSAVTALRAGCRPVGSLSLSERAASAKRNLKIGMRKQTCKPSLPISHFSSSDSIWWCNGTEYCRGHVDIFTWRQPTLEHLSNHQQFYQYASPEQHRTGGFWRTLTVNISPLNAAWVAQLSSSSLSRS